MNPTKNQKLTPEFFADKAKEFFMLSEIPMFTDKRRAEEFVEAFDAAIDAFVDAMKKDGSVHTENTIVFLGSPLGEAFCLLFDGVWHYSPVQERWVITCKASSGDIIELNVFRKLEKRLENGMEDSILYYLATSKKLLAGGLELQG